VNFYSSLIGLDEERNGAIVGALRLLGEIAGGELAIFPVIVQTFAAPPLSGTGLICAVAFFQIQIQVALHSISPLSLI
jgi:hypothetical protein